MKATEAKSISEKNAQRIEREKAAESAKRKVARERQEAARREKFRIELQEDADSSIKWAVDNGSKSTRVVIGKSQNTPVDAGEQYSKHEYLDEIKKLEGKLKKDGYGVKMDVGTNKHTTQHESTVPDYDYYTHYAYLEISWK